LIQACQREENRAHAYVSLTPVHRPSQRPHRTAQEALEPLFLQIEAEAELRMIAAALKAGWSAEDAVTAIDELRRNELLPDHH
jgi:hypothetical protein